MNEKRKYDSTVARMAGNILGGMFVEDANDDKQAALVVMSVKLARAIIAEVERTSPPQETP